MNTPKENLELAIKYLHWNIENVSVQEIAKETGLTITQIINSPDILRLLKENDRLKGERRKLFKQMREIDKKIARLE